MKKENWFYILSIIVGALVWVVIAAISRRTEAWDSPLYFSVGLPLLAVVVGVLAFIEPNRYWRWAVLPMAAQVVCILFSNGIGNMLPLGIVFFGVLTLPLLLAARLGAWLGRRRTAIS